MKKIIPVAGLILVLMSACSNSGTNETTGAATLDSSASTEAQRREKEINDSTKMLDKKLSDPNSSYSPDSLK